MMWLWPFIIVAWTAFSYLAVTTIVDIALMGALHFKMAHGSCTEECFIAKQNRIDMQTGFMCSGYASAYVLRHFGIAADGKQLYEDMPNKMRSGYTYPKGIKTLFQNYSFQAAYCSGNIKALKRELNKGAPIIVMIRVEPKRNFLHYVPVVGYDKEYIYLAESLSELVNCDNAIYNRKVKTRDFLKLWNTAMLKQPLYRNTFYVVEKKSFDFLREDKNADCADA